MNKVFISFFKISFLNFICLLIMLAPNISSLDRIYSMYGRQGGLFMMSLVETITSGEETITHAGNKENNGKDFSEPQQKKKSDFGRREGR